MRDFIDVFLTLIIIPILVNIVSSLLTDKIKNHSTKFGDRESGKNKE